MIISLSVYFTSTICTFCFNRFRFLGNDSSWDNVNFIKTISKKRKLNESYLKNPMQSMSESVRIYVIIASLEKISCIILPFRWMNAHTKFNFDKYLFWIFIDSQFIIIPCYCFILKITFFLNLNEITFHKECVIGS